MDEDISIINHNTRISLIKKFFKENIKKIFALFFIVITTLLVFFVYDEFKKRKNANLAEAYNRLIFNTNNFSNDEIKNKLIEIINGKVDTYSTLALYYIIDNNLVDDQDKINELFNTIISINKDTELKNLIIFKKALYFSDKLQENELLEILNPIINSESIWKQHALLLMGDFYFYNKQFSKSKEFFKKIIELKNSNPNLKNDVEKRLNRDFNE
tara:strand:- start:1416 stop:2057 length:642 start_codon:yes stop_codon:yes gene_type:complete